MLSPYVDIFIDYLILHSDIFSAYFPIFVFLSALIESTPFIGTFTPGTLLFLFFGFSGFNLNLDLSLMIFAGTMGAILGDMFGYMLGKYGSGFLLKHKKLLKHSHVEEGSRFLSDHGIKSIFIGRFIGPIRSVLPVIAGTVSMKFSKFMFYNILSAFIWVFIYVLIGYFFGNYFREIESFISNTGVILTLIIIIFVSLYYSRFSKNKNNKK